MNLDDLKRLHKECTFAAAMVTPCKVCGLEAKYVVPPDGIFCKEHLPEGSEIMSYEEYVALVKQKKAEAERSIIERIGEAEYGEE